MQNTSKKYSLSNTIKKETTYVDLAKKKRNYSFSECSTNKKNQPSTQMSQLSQPSSPSHTPKNVCKNLNEIFKQSQNSTSKEFFFMPAIDQLRNQTNIFIQQERVCRLKRSIIDGKLIRLRDRSELSSQENRKFYEIISNIRSRDKEGQTKLERYKSSQERIKQIFELRKIIFEILEE